MRMKVPVANSIMLVHVAVNAEGADECDPAETNEHDPDDPLDRRSKIIRESPAGERERATDQENHDRVAKAPTRSNRQCTPPVGSSADEDTNRGEMVGRERVSGAENESGD